MFLDQSNIHRENRVTHPAGLNKKANEYASHICQNSQQQTHSGLLTDFTTSVLNTRRWSYKRRISSLILRKELFKQESLFIIMNWWNWGKCYKPEAILNEERWCSHYRGERIVSYWLRWYQFSIQAYAFKSHMCFEQKRNRDPKVLVPGYWKQNWNSSRLDMQQKAKKIIIASRSSAVH